MQELLDIEAIKQLKGRYFRSLDTNDWETLSGTFTEDCVSSYSDGAHSYNDREGIVGFLSGSMSGTDFMSTHTGHTPEITLTSETTATGIWYLQDTVIILEHNLRIYGAGMYYDEYTKIDGQWYQSKIGYKRTYECSEPLPEGHRVKRNMWAERAEAK